MTTWTQQDVPSQKGRTALITGTSGLGLQTAIALTRAGATVIIAGRNDARGAEAVAAVRSAVSGAAVSFELVDLADLASIRALGSRLRDQRTSLDVLVNNAGLMAPPKRRETADGFELQFGTNYLGPFALTHELLPLLQQGADPRVVTVASLSANDGTINLDDLQSRQGYQAVPAYAHSKLADLMFALELQRRSDTHGWGITSIAVHPGLSRTELVANGAGATSLLGRVTKVVLALMGQPADRGALPALFAATSPDALGGHYYGPNGFRELKGTPTEARIPDRANDATVAARLWHTSQELTS
jgi:NAD(P)-dependent dehydrogenase (short-subunit alcohol dehydrogenase family)